MRAEDKDRGVYSKEERRKVRAERGETVNLCKDTHLSEHRLIHLIVPVPAIAHQVDDNVLVVSCPPFGCHITHMHHRLGIICIHMKYWSTHHLQGKMARRDRLGD